MIIDRFRDLGRAVGQAQRYRTIVGVFLRYGYEDLARRLPLPSALRWGFRKTREDQEAIAALSQPEKLRRAFEELGPTFVKLGQLLSSRTHLLPREFTDELKKLQDSVPPLPFVEIRKVIESELGRPLGACFADLDTIPLGAASIAPASARSSVSLASSHFASAASSLRSTSARTFIN